MNYLRRAIAGALVVLAAACGGTAPKSTGPPAPHTSTPATTSAPDLNSELLAISDLPTGWSSVPNTEKGPQPKCLAHVTTTLEAGAHAEATFVYGSSGSAGLGELLFYVPGQAQRTMTMVLQALSGCGQISETLTSGGQSLTLTGTIVAMPFPAVADQSAAYELSLSGTLPGASGPVTLVVEAVVFRKTDTVGLVEYFSFGPPDPHALQPLVQDAVAKLS